MTPLEALTRSGHKYPESILSNLAEQGFQVLSDKEVADLEDYCPGSVNDKPCWLARQD